MAVTFVEIKNKGKSENNVVFPSYSRFLDVSFGARRFSSIGDAVKQSSSHLETIPEVLGSLHEVL
jgi:hypothetical protein